MTFGKVIVLGHIGMNPKLEWTPDGLAVSRFTAATNRRWTHKKTGEQRETVTWYRVVAYGGLAESCFEHLDKGRGVYLEGHLDPDPETGGPRIIQTDHGPRAAYELIAVLAVFLPLRDSGGPDAVPSERPALGDQPHRQ